jgi:uncharacterized protein
MRDATVADSTCNSANAETNLVEGRATEAGAIAADVAMIAAHTRRWVERFVIGLNLCPFAAPVLRAQQLGIVVCSHTTMPEMANAVLDELDRLQNTPERELATSVLVFSDALADFEEYLDFLALAEELLYESGLDGVVQIASFHPQYQFDGTALHDVANFTNRSPYPMLHFIREAAVSRAVENYAAPEQIPQRNIERLHALGGAAIAKLLLDIEQSVDAS